MRGYRERGGQVYHSSHPCHYPHHHRAAGLQLSTLASAAAAVLGFLLRRGALLYWRWGWSRAKSAMAAEMIVLILSHFCNDFIPHAHQRHIASAFLFTLLPPQHCDITCCAAAGAHLPAHIYRVLVFFRCSSTPLAPLSSCRKLHLSCMQACASSAVGARAGQYNVTTGFLFQNSQKTSSIFARCSAILICITIPSCIVSFRLTPPPSRAA